MEHNDLMSDNNENVSVQSEAKLSSKREPGRYLRAEDRLKLQRAAKTRRKVILTVIMLIFIGTAVFSAIQIFKDVAEYQQGSNTYENLGAYVQVPMPPEKPIQATVPEADESEIITSDDEIETTLPEPTEPPIDWPVVDFEGLLSINEDCVGWIMIDDTKINYPIVQGNDNNYYLRRLFDGTWNSAGCIFLDYRVAEDFSYRNNPIYGHKMNNGSMFADLSNYKKQEYYDLHPIGYLLTPEQNYQIEFFAGFVIRNDGIAWDYEFESDDDFEEWLIDVQEMSCFDSEIQPEVTDTIITLSTCSYEFSYARFVLLGRLK